MTQISNWTVTCAAALVALFVGVGCGDDGSTTPMDDAGMGNDASTQPDGSTGDSGSAGETEALLSCTADAPTADPGSACRVEAPTPPADPASCDGSDTIDVAAGDLTEDTTWTCGNTYVLGGEVYVRDSVLTIEPGVTVQGSGDGAALIVTATGRVEAEGTPGFPIVFTSSNDEGNRAPGDWGGVVLLGRAPINVPGGSNNIEGLDPEEERGIYGGDDADHNCGTLRYVRIEWAGFTFGEDNELNGLTLGGCGRDTTLDYIQVHGGLDDGIEFFGGTADLKHALVTAAGDDSLDTDQGYQGRVQFFIAQQDSRGNRAIEADNLEDNEDLTPRSSPQIWNATFIGAGQAEQQGFRLRRGTAGMLSNLIVTNFTEESCVRVDGSATITQVEEGNLVLSDVMATGCGTRDGMDAYVRFTPDDGDVVTLSEATEMVWCAGNDFGVDPMLPADATNLDAPDFVPAADSPANGTGQTPPDDGFFDTSATFLGAIEPGDCWDWTAGWTAFPAPAE
jgi:hypothetical protein